MEKVPEFILTKEQKKIISPSSLTNLNYENPFDYKDKTGNTKVSVELGGYGSFWVNINDEEIPVSEMIRKSLNIDDDRVDNAEPWNCIYCVLDCKTKKLIFAGDIETKYKLISVR